MAVFTSFAAAFANFLDAPERQPDLGAFWLLTATGLAFFAPDLASPSQLRAKVNGL